MNCSQRPLIFDVTLKKGGPGCLRSVNEVKREVRASVNANYIYVIILPYTATYLLHAPTAQHTEQH